MVRFIDYGNCAELSVLEHLDHVSPSDLFELDESFSTRPYSICTLPCGAPETELLGRFLVEQIGIQLNFRRPKDDQVWLVDIPVLESAEKSAFKPIQKKNYNFTDRPGQMQYVDPKRKVIFLSFDDEMENRDKILVRKKRKGKSVFRLKGVVNANLDKNV